MQVFKALFKIIYKMIPSLLIYLIVFILLAMMLTLFFEQPKDSFFEPAKPRIAVFNEDAPDPYTEAFIEWLSQKTEIVEIPDEREKIQDALFYRFVTYVLRIPSGFGRHIMEGNPDAVKLIRTVSPDDWSGITVDLLIERYISQSLLYIKGESSLNVKDLKTAVWQSLSYEADIRLKSGQKTETSPITYYFSYLSYSMMAIIILGITSVLSVFDQTDLWRRNLVSPIRLIQYNAQLVLGCLLFSVIVWFIMVMSSLFLGASHAPVPKLWLWSLNALVFAFSCLSLSFLLSRFIHSKAAQQSIANVLALATCFLGGVFVPQELLGETVHLLGSFTPTYWSVRAINQIDRLSSFSYHDIRAVIQSMLIQAGFTLAFLSAALAVARQKRQSHF